MTPEVVGHRVARRSRVVSLAVVEALEARPARRPEVVVRLPLHLRAAVGVHRIAEALLARRGLHADVLPRCVLAHDEARGAPDGAGPGGTEILLERITWASRPIVRSSAVVQAPRLARDDAVDFVLERLAAPSPDRRHIAGPPGIGGQHGAERVVDQFLVIPRQARQVASRHRAAADAHGPGHRRCVPCSPSRHAPGIAAGQIGSDAVIEVIYPVRGRDHLLADVLAPLLDANGGPGRGADSQAHHERPKGECNQADRSHRNLFESSRFHRRAFQRVTSVTGALIVAALAGSNTTV